MPITPAAIPVMAGALVASGSLGFSVPQLATGAVNGVIDWTKAVQVLAVASGTLGAGVGTAPLIVPPPTLYGPLTSGFATSAILGPLAPLLIAGLANGLSQTLGMGIVVTAHPTVGVGAGVARFLPPPAAPFFINALSGAGMSGVGAVQLGVAIGQALTVVFSALTLPLVVVGPPSIVPSGGSGTGVIT